MPGISWSWSSKGLWLPTHNLWQGNYKWSYSLRELHTTHLCHFIEAKGQTQSNDVTVKSWCKLVKWYTKATSLLSVNKRQKHISKITVSVLQDKTITYQCNSSHKLKCNPFTSTMIFKTKVCSKILSKLHEWSNLNYFLTFINTTGPLILHKLFTEAIF